MTSMAARTIILPALALTLVACGGSVPTPAPPADIPAAVAEEEAPAENDGAEPAGQPAVDAPAAADCASADDCNNKGAFALIGGQNELGLALFARACELGSGAGCLNLGRQYYGGERATEDKPRARELFAKGCELGEAESCFNAALMHVQGDGGGADPVRATTLFAQACEDGHALGCGNAGVMYFQGQGVALDHAKAQPFFEKACDGGEQDGCFNLAVVLFKGQGVTHDPARAEQLFAKLCDGGDKDACTGLEEVKSKTASAAGGKPADDPEMARYGQRISVESMTADGLTVQQLRCGLGSGGLFAALGIVGALAGQKKAFDRCARKGGAVDLTWEFAGGKVTDVVVDAAHPTRVGKCAAKALRKAKLPFEGRCAARVLLGPAAGAERAAAELSK
jgi:TPR repeat protein